MTGADVCSTFTPKYVPWGSLGVNDLKHVPINQGVGDRAVYRPDQPGRDLDGPPIQYRSVVKAELTSSLFVGSRRICSKGIEYVLQPGNRDSNLARAIGQTRWTPQDDPNWSVPCSSNRSSYQVWDVLRTLDSKLIALHDPCTNHDQGESTQGVSSLPYPR